VSPAIPRKNQAAQRANKTCMPDFQEQRRSAPALKCFAGSATLAAKALASSSVVGIPLATYPRSAGREIRPGLTPYSPHPTPLPPR
jgi:hypothetical protein